MANANAASNTALLLENNVSLAPSARMKKLLIIFAPLAAI
jgi:hypothetical protein